MIETGEFKVDPLSRLLRRMKRRMKTINITRDPDDDKSVTIFGTNRMTKMTIELHEDDHDSINEWIHLFDG
jgi:hypothetical protein